MMNTGVNSHAFMVKPDEVEPGATINGRRVLGWARMDTSSAGMRYAGFSTWHTDIAIKFEDGRNGYGLMVTDKPL